MFRSFFLFLLTNPEKGLTECVNVLKRTPIYAILYGFDYDDLPVVGTFYEFFRRFWLAVDNNLKPMKQPKRKSKPKKGKKGEKAPTATPGRVNRLVTWMMRHADKKTPGSPQVEMLFDLRGYSDAKYGRTYHTHSSDNLRLFPRTARGSEKWRLIYKRCTSIERSNKQEKIDYKFESGRHRSTMMWYIRIYGIMTCQHMYAWYVSQKDEWDKLKATICPTVA